MMTKKYPFKGYVLLCFGAFFLSAMLITNFWRDSVLLLNLGLAISGLAFGGLLMFFLEDHQKFLGLLRLSIEETNPSKLNPEKVYFSKLYQVARNVHRLLGISEHNRMAFQDILNGDFSKASEEKHDHDDVDQAHLTREFLLELIENVSQLFRSSSTSGPIGKQVKLAGAQGAWRDLIDGVNHLINQMEHPITHLGEIINGLAEGDLTLRCQPERAEAYASMFQHLNDALDNLDGLLFQVHEASVKIDAHASDMKTTSQEINQSIGETAVAIDQISQGSNEQHIRVNECLEYAEKVLAASHHTKSHASHILEASQDGAARSKQGLEAIKSVSKAIHDIGTSSQQSDQAMDRLHSSAKKVSSVLRVMEELAAQTNLLALNASIEAANAGEQGRAFGVVAEEIRNLATEAKTSTLEIDELLGDMHHNMQETNTALRKVAKTVSNGMAVTEDANTAFEEIFESAEKTSGLAKQIFEASDKQLVEVSGITGSLENIVVVAEQNASGTNEIAVSMNEQTTSLVGLNSTITDLSSIAAELKEGLSMVRLTGKASQNNLIYKMKAAFEHEKYLLDALLNNMPDAIYFKDRESKFIRNSQSHARLFGLDRAEQLLGKSDQDFFGEHALATQAEEKRIMVTGEPLLNAVEKEDLSNGEVRYVSTTKMPLYDIESNIVGTFGISRDITEMKTSEDEKKKLLDAQRHLNETITDLRRENETLKLKLTSNVNVNLRDAS